MKFRGDGELIDEFSTLVRVRGSSEEARAVHGIADSALKDAPRPAEAWAELLEFWRGAIVVSHNLPFERGFIEAEGKRQHWDLADTPAVCTLSTTRRHLDGRAFSLKALHKHVSGGWRDDEHQALGDARATKDLLLWLIENSPTPMYLQGEPASPDPLPDGTVRCVAKFRHAPLTGASVAAVLESLPQSATAREGDADAIAAYVSLLDDVLDDGRLTFDEAQGLATAAVRTGLSAGQLREHHHTAFQSAFGDALTGDVSKSRLAQMNSVAAGLGLDDVIEKLALLQPESASEEEKPRYLRGKRFGFVGDSEEISALRSRALENGAPLVKNITKTVIWVAADDADGTSRHHMKARELGIRILDVRAASAFLDDEIGLAEQKQFEREQSLLATQAEIARWREEADRYWRPTWRRSELAKDPGPNDW